MRAAGPRLQVACKPNSVEDDHSSRRRIAAPLKRPTRRFPTVPVTGIGTRVSAPGQHASAARVWPADSLPIWSCSVWGLPCHRLYRRRGALLPHLFTLTPSDEARGGIFSVALAVFEP